MRIHCQENGSVTHDPALWRKNADVTVAPCMTVRELTKALGYIGSGHVSEIETGKRLPTAEFILKVARYFDVSADQLLKDELELDEVSELPSDSDDTA